MREPIRVGLTAEDVGLVRFVVATKAEPPLKESLPSPCVEETLSSGENVSQFGELELSNGAKEER